MSTLGASSTFVHSPAENSDKMSTTEALFTSLTFLLKHVDSGLAHSRNVESAAKLKTDDSQKPKQSWWKFCFFFAVPDSLFDAKAYSYFCWKNSNIKKPN